MSAYDKLLNFRERNIERFSKKGDIFKEETFRRVFDKYCNELDFEYEYQKIIAPYIVDFYIPIKCMVIEFDESHHNKTINNLKDAYREQFIMSIGIVVIRYSGSLDKNEMYNFLKRFINENKAKDKRIARVKGGITKLKNFYSSTEKFDKYESYKRLFEIKRIKGRMKRLEHAKKHIKEYMELKKLADLPYKGLKL